mmetsp:Transcript_1501/g.3516  ORF Transcript_1501/g.3516 Transcript_1501/m.3516 type:complete len:183 (+) Transcript_1501:121-669(+)|eukprot:g12768.t1
MAEEEAEVEAPVVLGPDEFRLHSIGATYKGQYVQDEEGEPILHGEGEYVIGPERFCGTFDNGSFVNGVYESRNGHRYEGPFLDNKFHGTGSYSWPGGRKFRGEFREGKLFDGEFQGFVTLDELRKTQAEAEVNKSARKRIEFGRDCFAGLIVDQCFDSNPKKQLEWRKAYEAAQAEGAQEGE